MRPLFDCFDRNPEIHADFDAWVEENLTKINRLILTALINGELEKARALAHEWNSFASLKQAVSQAVAVERTNKKRPQEM